VILIAFATAAICFLTTVTGWPGTLLAVLALALGCVVVRDRALLAGPWSPRSIEFHPSGEAVMRLGGGESASLSAVPGVGVTRYWVALASGLPSRRGLLIVSDMVGEDAFRLLRIWALWGKVPGVAPRQLPG
jgi:hypothetical protein